MTKQVKEMAPGSVIKAINPKIGEVPFLWATWGGDLWYCGATQAFNTELILVEVVFDAKENKE
jgi:hypothetical protein